MLFPHHRGQANLSLLLGHRYITVWGLQELVGDVIISFLPTGTYVQLG